MNINQTLSKEFHIAIEYINNIVTLLDESNTIAFIARYRKEKTNACDDQVLQSLFERLNYLRNLEKTKEQIAQSITEQEKMTDELSQSIRAAVTLAELEDIYRPFKPKRRTRATAAKEKGLEPLAQLILEQTSNLPPDDLALPFVDTEQAQKGVKDVKEALDGACDIIAEIVSDNAVIRKQLRDYAMRFGNLRSVAKKEEDSVYATYYDHVCPVKNAPSHRVLAMNRGENEGFLHVSLVVDAAVCTNIAVNKYVRDINQSTTSPLVAQAAKDAYARLIAPSIEREVRSELTAAAATGAIAMFGLNLKPLLLAPPIKGKTVLGLDPAYRTGCKIAVVDHTGKLLDYTVIYPTPPQSKVEEAKRILRQLIDKYDVDVISIGNGTATKESEIFVSNLLKELKKEVQYLIVNEAGASVYSASKLGAKEFPDLDVTIRSAISIARRAQDPLAELVKIDPKSIGVGQYQHDMPQAQLDSTLKSVVEGCVNSVGVDLNTASAELLTYISGLNATVAKNIVAYRDENGQFESRSQLKKVPRLGTKAFEQCAGFLRIPGAKNLLDNTSVHPESYQAAKQLLELCGFSLKASAKADKQSEGFAQLPEKLQQLGAQTLADQCGVGALTLKDIANELVKPGRDIRGELQPKAFRADILDIADLKVGEKLRGVVRNVIDFGVFVDIGVHQDGLVHISRLCNKFIKHPSEVVKVGDEVDVWVLAVDTAKKRISLSMVQS